MFSLLNSLVTILVIVGALNWGFEAMEMNLVTIVTNPIKQVVDLPYEKIVYMMVAMSGIVMAIRKLKN